MSRPTDDSGELTIDLAALAANWTSLARRVAPARCAAVVKANAYGLGIEVAVPALFGAGCRDFFVAHPREGARVRAVVGEGPRIYVLNGLQAAADPALDYAAHGLAPVIGSFEELRRWRSFDPAGARPFALHLDTGMNRLGFASLDELRRAAEAFGLQGAALLISHFVSAEAPNDPLNAAQVARFAAARAAFPQLPAALANSSGVFLPEARGFDLVRPGYALYGGNPTPGAENPMRAVVALDVAIQQIRWIEAGETCGYNSQWTARRRTRLATLLAGYADGLPGGAGATDARPGAFVKIAGRICPLVGRVSMDLTIADVTDLPEDAVQPGVMARFFGPDMPLDDFAARSGAVGYSVLTGLGSRYARTILPV